MNFKLHKSESGFTLVELMVTIVILTLIVAIAVPVIGNIVTNAEKNSEATSIAMIEKAGSIAEVAGLDHDNDHSQWYLLTTLIEAGYLDMDVDDDLVAGGSYVQKVGDAGITYEYIRVIPPTPLEMFEFSAPDENGGVLVTNWLGNTPDVVIPHTDGDGNIVVGIGEYAFNHVSGSNPTASGVKISSVVFPDSIKTIGQGAFRDNHLKHIDIPDNVTRIEKDTFDNNAQLESVQLPENLTYVGGSAFRSNNLTSLDLPEGLVTVENWAFGRSNNASPGISSITLPSSLKKIGSYAFRGHDLTSIIIPENVTSIGETAFYNNNIETVIVKSTNLSIKERYYSGEGLFDRNAENITVYGHSGSTIHTEALEYGYNFKLLSEYQ